MRLAVALLALAACTDDPAPSGPDVTSQVETLELPPKTPHAIDVLFVVGDVAGRDLRPLAAAFEHELPTWFGGFPDVRVAVASSDEVLALKSDVYGTQTQSFAGSFTDALAQKLAAVTPTAQVLARTQSAAAFTEPNHYLAVVTLSATDDQSPDADYAAALKATKSDPGGLIVSGVYTRPAPRLDAFLDAFPNRSSFTPLDTTDYTAAFEPFRTVQRTTLEGPPCVSPPLDLDPSTPGEQVDCNASAWTEDGVELARIPRCDGGAPATGSCWDVVADPMNCLIPNTVAFRIRGTWAGYRPRIRWECVTK